MGLPSSHVTRAITHALTSEHPQLRYRVGLDARLIHFLGHFPRLGDYVCSVVYKTPQYHAQVAEKYKL
jgi:hypothetical protein